MFFGPKNSLILLYDLVDPNGVELLASQLKETRKYYDFVKLSTLVEKKSQGKGMGLCALSFKHPRKNFQLFSLPLIQDLDLPVTLFLQPECVGTNRLPLLEEIEWLQKEFPNEIGPEWRNLFIEDPEKAEDEFGKLRKKLGNLPVQKIGPESFYLTWGNLLDLNPQVVEFGLTVPTLSKAWVQEAKKYAETQLSKPLLLAYTPLSPSPFFSELGFKGVLTENKAMVEKSTSLLALPQWDLA